MHSVMVMPGRSYSSLSSSYRFGLQGQEHDNEWTGTKDGNVHFKFRDYDPRLGRFKSVDPLADKYAYNSTYAFQENKLGLGTELEGRELLRGVANLYRQIVGESQIEKSNAAKVVDQSLQNAASYDPYSLGENLVKDPLGTTVAVSNSLNTPPLVQTVIDAVNGPDPNADPVREKR